MRQERNQSRRQFLQNTAAVGTGILLSGAAIPRLFAHDDTPGGAPKRVPSKGYAARDASGKLSPWSFERRPVGDSDILIDIKFAGICHSDIHQLRGEWGPQKYPQVPGHEIAGVVAAGITQGGYSNNIVVTERFAIPLPKTLRLQDAAPLLCAGITTYSPLMKASIKQGVKVGVAGIGGLGHMAIQLAASKGADVYAFTSSASKVSDIQRFGAKEVIVVDSLERLKPFKRSLDFMISTIPVNYSVAAYASMVKPYGNYVQVGMPAKGEVTLNNFLLDRVRYSVSLIGGIPQTREIVDYCAENHIAPQVQLIKASEADDAWNKVINKQARYRYVIDASTF
jgi:alcohol dehydrogenase (NADP+)/uncharacterized zinc-type alcohol dehydrogenase-like protein